MCWVWYQFDSIMFLKLIQEISIYANIAKLLTFPRIKETNSNLCHFVTTRVTESFQHVLLSNESPFEQAHNTPDKIVSKGQIKVLIVFSCKTNMSITEKLHENKYDKQNGKYLFLLLVY